METGGGLSARDSGWVKRPRPQRGECGSLGAVEFGLFGCGINEGLTARDRKNSSFSVVIAGVCGAVAATRARGNRLVSDPSLDVSG